MWPSKRPVECDAATLQYGCHNTPDFGLAQLPVVSVYNNFITVINELLSFIIVYSYIILSHVSKGYHLFFAITLTDYHNSSLLN